MSRLADSALESDGVLALTRAKLLNSRCYIQSAAGAWASVPALANEALVLARGVGDSIEEGRALGYLGVVMALGVVARRQHGPTSRRPSH